MDKSKIKSDLIWSFASFAVVGFGGILLNVLIGNFWGAETLGVFNQIFSFYFILGHMGCFGIHYSVLKFASEYGESDLELISLYSSAIFLTFFLAITLLGIGHLSRSLVGDLFHSIELENAWTLALPAFTFFSLNKICLNFLNGKRKIKLMAFLNALRFILYIIFLFYFYHVGIDDVVKILVYSEGLVFVIAFIFLIKYFKISKIKINWIRNHLNFSKFTFITGFIQNIETRIDILMLGIFLDDFTVGIYSFASMLTQGAYQIPVVIRNNLNPIISQLYFRGEKEALERLITTWIKKLYFVAILLGLMALLIYKPFVMLVTNNLNFLDGYVSFSILIVGIIVASAYIPFNMIFVQIGNLKEHFSYYVMLLVINILLNLALIPVLGMKGAAISTATVYVASVFILKFKISKVLKIKI